MAVIVTAASLAHFAGELTVTVGLLVTDKVPEPLPVQVVLELVITTLYKPATDEVNDATLPGAAAPAGTVQA